MQDDPIINAFMVGEDVQVLMDVGPGMVGMDLIQFNEAGYDAALEFVRLGQFQPRREYPPQPSAHHVWDMTARTWIDPRTPADLHAALYAAREQTTLEKPVLLMRATLPEFGFLTAEEAVEAAQGRIPLSFEPAIAALPAEAQMLARIKWAGDQFISRMNPLLLMAAHAKGISDEQMDQFFGVVAPV